MAQVNPATNEGDFVYAHGLEGLWRMKARLRGGAVHLENEDGAQVVGPYVCIKASRAHEIASGVNAAWAKALT